jgi:hypothetical protein
MNFLYFYPRKRDGKLRYDIPIHIATDEAIYLCGMPQTNEPVTKTGRPKPGLKLCEICMEERKRLMTREPTIDQVKNWWVGGLDGYRKEMVE